MALSSEIKPTNMRGMRPYMNGINPKDRYPSKVKSYLKRLWVYFITDVKEHLCLLEIHTSLKRVGEPIGIDNGDEFNPRYRGHYALAKCGLCGQLVLKYCFFQGGYCPTISKGEFWRMYRNGHLAYSLGGQRPPIGGTAVSRKGMVETFMVPDESPRPPAKFPIPDPNNQQFITGEK